MLSDQFTLSLVLKVDGYVVYLKSPLRKAFWSTVPSLSHKFTTLFSFSFLPKHFLKSLVFSSLTHWLFKCGSFHICTAADLPDIFQLLMFHCSWRKHFVAFAF